MRSGAGGAPGAVRDGGVSESVAKAPRAGIRGGQKRGISTILFRRFGAIRTFATDLDKRRTRGPLRGRRPRRSPRSRPRAAPGPPPPAPGRRNVHFALERALLTAHLEGRMHISTSAGPTRSHRPGRLPSAPPRADPDPRTTTPGEKGSVRRAPSPPRAPTTTHHAKWRIRPPLAPVHNSHYRPRTRGHWRRGDVPHPHPQEAGEDQRARMPPAEPRPIRAGPRPGRRPAELPRPSRRAAALQPPVRLQPQPPVGLRPVRLRPRRTARPRPAGSAAPQPRQTALNRVRRSGSARSRGPSAPDRTARGTHSPVSTITLRFFGIHDHP